MNTSGFHSGDSTRNRILINNANNKDSNSLSNPTVSAKMWNLTHTMQWDVTVYICKYGYFLFLIGSMCICAHTCHAQTGESKTAINTGMQWTTVNWTELNWTTSFTGKPHQCTWTAQRLVSQFLIRKCPTVTMTTNRKGELKRKGAQNKGEEPRPLFPLWSHNL